MEVNVTLDDLGPFESVEELRDHLKGLKDGQVKVFYECGEHDNARECEIRNILSFLDWCASHRNITLGALGKEAPNAVLARDFVREVGHHLECHS